MPKHSCLMVGACAGLFFAFSPLPSFADDNTTAILQQCQNADGLAQLKACLAMLRSIMSSPYAPGEATLMNEIGDVEQQIQNDEAAAGSSDSNSGSTADSDSGSPTPAEDESGASGQPTVPDTDSDNPPIETGDNF